MSVYSRYFLLAGYDLTELRTDKFGDWRYTEEGQDYFTFRQKKNICFFDGLEIGNELYFGYVLAVENEYEFCTEMCDMTEMERISEIMKQELESFQEDGIIKEGSPPFKIILFGESALRYPF